jgi:hypothetical protein
VNAALSRKLGTAMQREPLVGKSPKWKLAFTRRVAQAEDLADLADSDRKLVEQALTAASFTENGPAGVTAAASTRGSTMPRTWVSDPFLAPFGEPTGDGRIFKVGSLVSRELPLPLLFQESSGWGHEGSVVVGRITAVEFTDAGIKAEGDYLDDEAVSEQVGKAVALTEQGLGHVSVDLAAVVAELVDENGDPVDMDDLFDAWDEGIDLVVLEQVTEGELIAATQVATPAFASAKIRLNAALQDSAGTDIGVGDTVDVDTGDGTVRGRVTAVDEPNTTVTVQPTDADGNDTTDDPLTVAPAAVTVVTAAAQATLAGGMALAVDAGGADIGVGDRVSTDLRDENGEVTEAGFEGVVTAVTEAEGDAAATVTIQADDAARDPVTVPASSVTVISKAPAEEPPAGQAALAASAGRRIVVTDRAPVTLASLAQKAPALTASAGLGPLRPRRGAFDKRQLRGPTAMTITDDGECYGHLAVWGTCHVAFANTCWEPPPSPSDYAYFHVGEVVCDDGSHVPVGNLTLGPRHANERLAYRAAVEHYDQAGAGVAVARVYEDDFGIQFDGALTPGVTEEQVYDMRRCPVSGDWRKIGGALDLIGVLSVNSGGYPTPRMASDDWGRTALVAAPGVRPDPPDGTGRRRRTGLSQRQLEERIRHAVKAEIVADQQRQRRLAHMAAAIGRDPRSRMAELARRVRP